MAVAIEKGCDVAITPDGPRGPRYVLHPGTLLLAQRTKTPVTPVSIEHSRALRLPTWDRFFVPLPFSCLEVSIDKLIAVERTAGHAAFEAERARIETLLQPQTR